MGVGKAQYKGGRAEEDPRAGPCCPPAWNCGAQGQTWGRSLLRETASLSHYLHTQDPSTNAPREQKLAGMVDSQ
jgi:hypothetical protein